ncbi:ParB N-terminal domain-containing protein [Marinifilum fragile]|uniref:ParB N-terminal domain-containing protein n=1 Tax=Marinifilum fragile TaxID=570161 RepID=UPI002AA708FB|nr:ParB N-terminal domain-containing protein [Marinifilum fragile]
MAYSKDIGVSDLVLDLYSARIPSYLRGKEITKVINYFVIDESTIDLLQSIGENGFFEGEQLFVVPDKNGKYKVIDGNRRLTSVLLLNNPALATAKKHAVEQVVKEADPKPIDTLPCLVFDDEKDIRKYLGYRHVTGIKSWALSEKARYLFELYQDQFSHLSFQNACYEIAKTIGSTKNYICRILTAFQIYQYIEDESFFNIKGLDDTNFYVGYYSDSLLRANISDFLGINLFDENPIDSLNKDNVKKITKWFYENFELDGKIQTRLKGKSAELNDLNKVLGNEKAARAFIEEGYVLSRALSLAEDLEQVFSNSIRTALLNLENADRLTQSMDKFYDGLKEDLIQIRKITTKINDAKEALEKKDFDNDEL